MTEIQKIRKEDVEKFIIEHQYDEKGWDLPTTTIVLSTVKIHCRESNSDPQDPLSIKESHKVYKNSTEQC